MMVLLQQVMAVIPGADNSLSAETTSFGAI